MSEYPPRSAEAPPPADQATLPSRRDLRTRRRRTPRWVRLTLTLTAAVVLVALAVSTVAFMKLRGNIDTTNVTGLTEPAAADEPLNILLIGSDARENQDTEDTPLGKRSDSMVLMHISEDRSNISGLQIPRDTMIDAPACTDDDTGHSFPGGLVQVNSLLGYGQGCLVEAVEDMSGVGINHYVEIDFGGFADIVDAIGGVEVCLPEALQDSRAKLDLPAGEQKLQGEDALALARTRHSVGDGSDLARLSHQQMVMSAIVQQVKNDGILSNPTKLYAFLDAATSSVTVDESLGKTSTMASLGQQIADVPLEDIVFMSLPVVEYAPDPNRVQPSPDAQAVFQRLQNDEPIDGSADEPAASEPDQSGPELSELELSAGIDVRNGSGATGAAAALLEQFRSAGLLTGSAGNSEPTARSNVSYPAGLQEEAAQLASALGLGEDAVTAGEGPDFVVTIGEDFPDLESIGQSQPGDTAATSEATTEEPDSRSADVNLCE